MPSYDFVCNACQTRFETYLSFSEYGKKAVRCVRCGSQNVRRRMTRVRVLKSEESRLEALTEGFSGLEDVENDPKALGRMMRKMGKELGEDLPPQFDEAVERLESGQSPEEIESALPDLDEG